MLWEPRCYIDFPIAVKMISLRKTEWRSCINSVLAVNMSASLKFTAQSIPRSLDFILQRNGKKSKLIHPALRYLNRSGNNNWSKVKPWHQSRRAALALSYRIAHHCLVCVRQSDTDFKLFGILSFNSWNPGKVASAFKSDLPPSNLNSWFTLYLRSRLRIQ